MKHHGETNACTDMDKQGILFRQLREACSVFNRTTYKVPVAIRFVNDLPHTSAGKLQRSLLRTADG